MKNRAFWLGLFFFYFFIAQPIHAQWGRPTTSPFHGVYLGLNGGVFGYESDRSFLGFPATFTSYKINPVGGVQAGFDYACHGRLLGIVGEWSWVNVTSNTTLRRNVDPESEDLINGQIKWFTSIRARMGLDICGFLLYVTGGGVAGDVRSTIRSLDLSPETYQIKRKRWGWIAGLGGEWDLWRSFTMNAEVLYMRFQSQKVTISVPNPAINREGFLLDDAAWVARIGINYRFNR